MAENGAELSLDDYIKVKKKQGSFKIGRGRGGKVVTQKRNRKEGRAAVKNNRPVRTGIKVYKNRQSGFGGGRGSRSRYFNNVIAGAGNIIVGNQGRVPRAGGGRRGRGGYRNRITGGRQIINQIQPLIGSRYRNRNIRGSSQSQFLVRQAQQRLRLNVAGVQQRQRRNNNDMRSIGRLNKRSNRRAVQKLARKRVQRARLQLAKRKVVFRPETRRPGLESLMPLLSVTSGIRRTRTGFVTVSNPVDKQIHRLVVQEKIQKAQQIRNNRSFNNNPSSNNSWHTVLTTISPPRQQRPQQQYQQPRQNNIMPLMMSNFNYEPQRLQQNRHHPGDVRLRNDTQSRASLNHNQRSIPAMGMSMYADQEETQRMRLQHPRSQQQQQQQQWVVPPPSPPFAFRRTAVNNMYDPTNPAIDYYNMSHHQSQQSHALNPDIQRKINFIQNHGNNRSGSVEQRGGSGLREIIPDFRAPVSSSTMKLGDRFKMYMQ